MNILITGGTGFVGSVLVKALLEKGHTPYVLTRQSKESNNIHYLKWDPENKQFSEKLPQIDGLINLMGENIGEKRWSKKQKEKLQRSRIENTDFLNSILKDQSLSFSISASAVGIYAKNTEVELNESSAYVDDFLGSLCQKWEDKSRELKNVQRSVLLRIGVVLGKDGGMLKKLLPIFRLGLGGPIGNGKMIMSWIHVDDLVNIIIKAIEDSRYEGVINAVSPNPVTNAEFTKAFGRSIKRPAFFPVPPLALKVAMGEMSSLALDSQKIYPQRLTDLKHEFLFPQIDSALKDIFSST